MTLIPFPRVVARTASRPGTAGLVPVAVVDADVPPDDPKLLKSDEKGFFMRVLCRGLKH
jgi:hypothetical protein